MAHLEHGSFRFYIVSVYSIDFLRFNLRGGWFTGLEETSLETIITVAFASRQKPLNFGGDTSLSIFHSHHKWSIRQKPGWCGKITNLIIFLHQLRVVNIYMEIYEIILLKKIRFSFLFLYSFKKIYAWILLLCCLLSYTYFPASC